MRKFWQLVKENALFLVHYRRDRKRREEEMRELEIQLGTAQVELAFAMRAEQRARRERK